MEIIKSTGNSAVKRLRSLETKKGRHAHALFAIEGERYVLDIPEKVPIAEYFLSQSYFESRDIEWMHQKAKVHVLSDVVFKSVSDTMAPQGIIAVCAMPQYKLEMMLKEKDPFILLGECINDPGNLGTLIRTADAAGATGVILSTGCADVYNAKTIRATAGSIFNIPYIYDADILAAVDLLKANGVLVAGAHLNAAQYPYDVCLRNGVAIAVGNEANGMSDALAGKADVLVKLPMLGGVESLNASVAGGVLLYEVLRQRL